MVASNRIIIRLEIIITDDKHSDNILAQIDALCLLPAIFQAIYSIPVNQKPTSMLMLYLAFSSRGTSVRSPLQYKYPQSSLIYYELPPENWRFLRGLFADLKSPIK